MVECIIPVDGRRKIFWTTQPDACGVVQGCISECGSSGLKSHVPAGQKGRTFYTNDYVRGLMINIIGTKGRRDDSNCGWRPGTRGGHWADTYRTDGNTVGTGIYDIPAQTSVADCINLLRARLLHDMQKLVAYGVAQSVNVAVSYAGGNTFAVTVEAFGNDGKSSRVGLTGKRLENSWVWGTDK
jgi:phage gp46-like protein